MMNNRKCIQIKFNTLLPRIFVFLLLITFELLALVLVALIPKSCIQSNMETSAKFLCENDVFFYANPTDSSSKIDRYADSILLNIAYNYQSSNPLTSVMSSSYYHTYDGNENINLLTAVTEEHDATLEYSRYWHGSISIIRPMLTLFNIEQIYLINSIILVLLLIILLFLLTKYFGKGASLCFLIAAAMTSFWYIPMSLEYTWTILIMLVASIAVITKIKTESYDFAILFMVVGNVTAYFDFLTTETLTILVPLSIIITYKYLNHTLGSLLSEIKTLLTYGVAWLAGYIFTWLGKWSLASIILNRNVFIEAFKQAKFRAGGQGHQMSGLAQRFGAETRNIGSIFPFSTLGDNSIMCSLLFFAIVLSLCYIVRKEKCTYNKLLLSLATLPYLRFFILGNHSYLHYFFTFRAQLTTILCLSLLLVYGSDKKMLSKEWRKLWKKKSN